MRRVCARWVPSLLVPEQKTVRVQICTDLQQRLSDEDDPFLFKVITCVMKHGFISLSLKVSNKAQCGSILRPLHLKSTPFEVSWQSNVNNIL